MPTSPAPLLWAGEVAVATLDVEYGGQKLLADERKDLLQRLRAGEHIELEFEAITFAQGKGPNRNFLRFPQGELGRLAKSFKGMPFLRDHDKHSVLARGGTILSSRVERLDDGVTAFVQRIRATKVWAVEGLLDGTIDRFSIGFHPAGAIECSQHKAAIFTKCSCLPGDRFGDDEDERRVEFIFHGAEGVEVSGVNVPAVPAATGVGDIRAALSALNCGPAAAAKERTMNRLLTRLGLGEGAGEDQAIAVFDRLSVEHEATKERLKLVEGKLAERELESKRREAAQLELDVEQLYQTGRLPMKRDASGKRVPHELEVPLRRIYETLGYDGFKKYIDDMPATFGPGELQSKQTPADDQRRSSSPLDQRAFALNLDPTLLRDTLAQMGISEDAAVKYGPKQGV